MSGPLEQGTASSGKPREAPEPGTTAAPAPPSLIFGSELLTRIASAVVLAPMAIYLVYLGGWPFTALIMLVAVLMTYEWARLVHKTHLNADYVIHAITAIVAVGLTGAGHAVLGLAAALAGVAIAFAVVIIRGRGKRWPMIGFPYILLPCIAIVWLRLGGPGKDDDLWGMYTLYWLLAVVWATDISAYVVGRLIGGPKLAPRYSPAKTWSGLLGGMAGAAAAGAVTSAILDLDTHWLLAVVSGIIAVVAQIGDIAESALKRYANVKDSSHLIPGHGGILDRVDGLIFAVMAAGAAALAALVAGGGAGIGLGVFA